VVLLHASPGSSLGVVPLLRALAERGRTVIAADTPGFGESDPPAADWLTAADFARLVIEGLDALQLERFDLYGTHTGAKIALEVALAAPERVRSLALDGLAMYSAEEQRQQLERYTVSLAPEWDGSHVVRAWAYRRDMSLFWPWYRQDAAGRRRTDMPSPEQLHAQVVELLRAATTYQLGYYAAFSHDTFEAVQRLRVPTRILLRASDVLGGHLERLPPLPAGVTTASLAGDEIQTLAAHVLEAGGTAPLAAAPAMVNGTRRDYVMTSAGQMHLRRVGEAMLLDLPGHGESDAPPRLQHAGGAAPPRPPAGAEKSFEEAVAVDHDVSVGPWADMVAEAIRSAGLERVRLRGSGAAAAVAVEVALRHPGLVSGVVSEADPDPDPPDLPELAPRWDGAHLVLAWNIARNMHLFRPWYRETANAVLTASMDPIAVHRTFMQLVKAGPAWATLAQAAARYPYAEHLAQVRHLTDDGGPTVHLRGVETRHDLAHEQVE
jgi:pimeloyl-ACP methyl ester carboxylesterase